MKLNILLDELRELAVRSGLLHEVCEFNETSPLCVCRAGCGQQRRGCPPPRTPDTPDTRAREPLTAPPVLPGCRPDERK